MRQEDSFQTCFFFFLKKGFIWDIPNFAFLEKGLRTVSPQHFEHYFS